MTQRLRYAVFGPGRVGRNMAAYLGALGHEATLISRAQAETAGETRQKLIEGADVIAAAIPDAALQDWADAWLERLDGRPAIHFSGALLIKGLWSYHPLYSFPASRLDARTLRAVAFARQEGAPPLAEIMPGAPNPELAIPDRDRAYYHALAVLSGNYAAHVWNETARAFEARFGAPAGPVLAPYLAGVVERFAESPAASMTGPLARRDAASVRANLAALETADPRLAALYRAFLASAWPDFGTDA